jgi:phosphoglucomutase
MTGTRLQVGVDPLGGASVGYWGRIAEKYRLDLAVVNPLVDPTFRFMSVDWDGAIRMDPSSPHAMAGLVGMRDRYALGIAADPDADRHGVVCRSAGLLQPNHYLAVAIDYLYRHRSRWAPSTAVGKTVVSSALLDRVAARLGRKLVEVPVGFKHFGEGLLAGTLGFGGEESAGASFLRLDGTTWTTDKDGLLLGLLAIEMTSRLGRDPGELYRSITADLGEPAYARIDFAATDRQKAIIRSLSPADLSLTQLGGDKVRSAITRTADGQEIGGVKVSTEQAWFAVRPSGTENTCKLYAESFRGPEHLAHVQEEAQTVLEGAMGAR